MHSRFRRRILCSVALATAALSRAATASAQDAEAPPPIDLPSTGEVLDPASSMDDLPDLGVAWPDLDSSDDVAAGAGAPPLPGTPELPTAAVGETEADDVVSQGDVGEERHYRVAVSGLDGLEVSREKLVAQFDALSALKAGERKDTNVAQIDRRARDDESILRELLRARGYYDAQVRTRVTGRGADVITVTLIAEPGEIYRFAEVALPGIDAAGDKTDTLRKAFPVKDGDPVDAGAVVAGQTGLKLALGREGFAFGKISDPDITVDHDTQSATLSIAVDPGGAKRFGQIDVTGTPLFSAKHLGRIARFRPGDSFNSERVDDFRRALIQTGLVSSVALTPQQGADPEVVDIAVGLEPAPMRTIAGELGYGTGEGFRVEASWQHRNLISPEGAVTVRGVAGTQEQSLGVVLRRNNYKARDRVLNAQVIASHTQRDAYEAHTFTLGGSLERQTNIVWQKKWTWSLGAELVASDERDVIGATGIPRRRTYFIAAAPTTLSYDGSDDLLNPMRGFRLSGRVSPEVSIQGTPFTYVKSQIDASGYVPMNDRFTIAGRVRVGSIFGASRDRVAPSRRFYSGGGGSVRGYGYQDIGPRDLNDDPIGGRSLAEFSLEARVRFGNFGVVPFFDGGNIYTEAVPRFTNLRYGAGVGVRYYTSFGPIRLDVGTPINPQRGDARVAVYVSLGQAF